VDHVTAADLRDIANPRRREPVPHGDTGVCPSAWECQAVRLAECGEVARSARERTTGVRARSATRGGDDGFAVVLEGLEGMLEGVSRHTDMGPRDTEPG